ncbi:MAG: family 10 glycosylhydrolase [Muribaculaceae bacterium]|nr:family 10 glycosylhydrolase [Muribaculaceae bacterium]
MKQLLNKLLCAATVCVALASAPSASGVELREHRAVWCTPYLSDWPSSAITSNNAQRHKDILIKNLNNYKSQNVNVIYYHVRSMCDAAYDSKYEPWSKGVSGTRGKKPAFDPFEYLIQEAHARGIEVYAWLNPYRYCGQYAHEDTPLNYNNTHPEWLIVQSKETILNPALEEVKQRIVDVVMDIMDKYEIDGVVFDDYFYSNPTPMSLDEDLYKEAKKADSSIGSQLEWRIANVNSMIKRVHDAIKARAPWMTFGISPAGAASPPNIKSYGLEPCPESDWQYSSIASDPISWYAAGIVDYMSPQIYWPNKFKNVQQWWAKAAQRFNRHLYSSVSLSDFSTYGGEEYNSEVLIARNSLPENESGLVFFTHKTYINATEKINGQILSLGDQLAADAFSTPALAPIRNWNNVYAPVMTANVRRDGANLVWDEVPGMRYTVYSFAPGEEPMTLGVNFVQACYTNSLAIPEGMEGNTFGVCVYDRYNNEYPMLLEGAAVATAKPAELSYPADGQEAAALFDFTWEPTKNDNILEVAADADFSDVLGVISTRSNAVNSANISGLEGGKTYYWRVRTHPVNSTATVSAVRSFTVAEIKVLAPEGTDVVENPVISWTPAYTGAQYVVEVARKSDFKNIDFQATTTESSVEVPLGNLYTGYTYYVRVTAERDGRTSQSATAQFGTADKVYGKPSFVNPAVANSVLHANEAIVVDDWSGMESLVIQISSTEDFPTRTSYKTTLRKGATTSPELSTIKVNGKKLEDGAKYYVRAYGQYYTQATGSKIQETEPCVETFTYSAELGAADVVADAEGVYIESETLYLPASGVNVDVYAADGTCMMSFDRAPRTVALSQLPAGFYIVRAGSVTLKWVK